MSLFNKPKKQEDSLQICGLYYMSPASSGQGLLKVYLPQIDLQVHSTILSTTSRTVLDQVFSNPSQHELIEEVRYTFPLYDGVSVVSFTCHVGDRIIDGEVKEKERAQSAFREAVAQGEIAGLFDQSSEASDVFTAAVANIPPGADVTVKVTYLGELNHDMDIDGIRFTIPTSICPRYGRYPPCMKDTSALGTRIFITVDAEMAQGSLIQTVSSPSHPIAISMGTTSVTSADGPSMSKASATLSLGNASLNTDFVLQIVAKEVGVPNALLETHPDFPHQRALMATLVPKFALRLAKPEVVFVCDQSGSMGGSRNELLKQALRVFLKSLPVGVKFNICTFGFEHRFLWPRSVTYTQQTLDEAMHRADALAADHGGTEMLRPIKATIQQRYKDIPLEIMLLTDGEIWDQQALFSYLNTEKSAADAPIRVFTLGIGNGTLYALIEGIAKAGDGFSQAVSEGEKMDKKVVRMLKGALSPHVKDYSLEVKYDEQDLAAMDEEEEEDYDIVEEVKDSLTARLTSENEKHSEPSQPTRTISLFDPSAGLDDESGALLDASDQAQSLQLPVVPVPKIIQAPQRIPPLFAFVRTSIYLLLGPEAPQSTPKAVVLRGTSQQGELELEIPVQILESPGKTIHQLAAKKAISELEQGRGWLPEAKDIHDGKPLKEKFDSHFEDMVKREAVRLGVQFQVGSRWCSFVAVDKQLNQGSKSSQAGKDVLNPQRQATRQVPPVNISPHSMMAQKYVPSPAFSQVGGEQHGRGHSPFSQLFGFQLNQLPASASMIANHGTHGYSHSQSVCSPAFKAFEAFGVCSSNSPRPPFFSTSSTTNGNLFGGNVNGSLPSTNSGGLFGGSVPKPSPRLNTAGNLFGSVDKLTSSTASGGLLGGSNNKPAVSTMPGGLFDGSVSKPASSTTSGGGLFGSLHQPTPSTTSGGLSGMTRSLSGQDFEKPHLQSLRPTNSLFGSVSNVAHQMKLADPHTKKLESDEERLDALIALQTFSGSWTWTTELFKVICLATTLTELRDKFCSMRIAPESISTALVITFLETRMRASEGSWELVVEKAKDWLRNEIGEQMERALQRALEVV